MYEKIINELNNMDLIDLISLYNNISIELDDFDDSEIYEIGTFEFDDYMGIENFSKIIMENDLENTYINGKKYTKKYYVNATMNYERWLYSDEEARKFCIDTIMSHYDDHQIITLRLINQKINLN